MMHVRDITTGHEQRIETRKAVTYVYMASALCGRTQPANTLTTVQHGDLLLGEICPTCLARLEG